MLTELINIATEYSMGWKTIADVSEWLASINWDEGHLDNEMQELLGSLELLVTEVLEGLRPEAEFSQHISTLLIKLTSFVANRNLNTTYISSSNSSRQESGVSFQLTKGSQSWSISPLLVSG
jgi:hypothetical protein